MLSNRYSSVLLARELELDIRTCAGSASQQGVRIMFAQPAPDARPSRPRARALRNDEPVVGHRLANGYMAVHAIGQRCRYCDGDVVPGDVR